jgi:hypothetical protein
LLICMPALTDRTNLGFRSFRSERLTRLGTAAGGIR